MFFRGVALAAAVVFGASALAEGAAAPAAKADADGALKLLQDGNKRFQSGKVKAPHRDLERVKLAAASDQADYAVATVLSCADSRVPVEVLFDAGVMDLFVVRVAGNVADTDEVGSIEYGLAHVKTPLLVVLGHSGCGAVKAVLAASEGEGHALEKNIPPLVDNIAPAVKRAQKAHADLKGAPLIPFAVEENVWESVYDLFEKSAAVRELVSAGKVKVVGAVYDLPTGEVKWLDPAKPGAILAEVEKDPKRSTEAMAGGHAEGGHAEAGHAAEKKEAAEAKPAAPKAEIPVFKP